MTERDAIKKVVEQSITRTADIEVLRKWAKERYEECSNARYIPTTDESYAQLEGKMLAFREMISKLDELEVNG